MATLTVIAGAEGGIETSALGTTLGTAGTAGDEFANDGNTIFVAAAGGTGSLITVTVQTASLDVQGMGTMTKTSATGTIGTAGVRVFGPFPTGAYNNGNGRVAVSYSVATGLKVGAIRLPRVS